MRSPIKSAIGGAQKGRAMSGMDRVWMLWVMAGAMADDSCRWMRSSVKGRQRGQGLVEYAFTIISVVAIGIAVWALLQTAMNSLGERAAAAVSSVR
jgi:hypothetical protein